MLPHIPRQSGPLSSSARFSLPYRFVIHDRDSIFSPVLDSALEDFGVRVIKTPIRDPQANAYCERLIGTILRECLDYLIPINNRHLRLILKEFVCFYNRGLSSLGVRPCQNQQTNATAIPINTSEHRRNAICHGGPVRGINSTTASVTPNRCAAI